MEDKRAAIKRLIDQIPTDKYELFAWPMDWEQVDKVSIRCRLRSADYALLSTPRRLRAATSR